MCMTSIMQSGAQMSTSCTTWVYVHFPPHSPLTYVFTTLQVDPHQMHNLYPNRSHDEPGPTSSLDHMIARLDSLMMVMKSCKGKTCREPWKVLHPDERVTTLEQALHHEYDNFYQAQSHVSFTRCEPGYIVAAEGPQTGYQYRGSLGWSQWA
jgi:arylsulfatase